MAFKTYNVYLLYRFKIKSFVLLHEIARLPNLLSGRYGSSDVTTVYTKCRVDSTPEPHSDNIYNHVLCDERISIRPNIAWVILNTYIAYNVI